MITWKLLTHSIWGLRMKKSYILECADKKLKLQYYKGFLCFLCLFACSIGKKELHVMKA